MAEQHNMKTSTRQMIKILLESDDTIPIEQKWDIMENVTHWPKLDTRSAISSTLYRKSLSRGSEVMPLAVSQSTAAKLLSVSRPTIWRMIKIGQLHPVIICNQKKISLAEIEQIAGCKKFDK